MAETDGNWVRMALKGNKVWAETNGKGSFLLKNGKVRVKYNLAQDHEYLVPPSSLAPAEQAKPAAPKAKAKKKTAPKSSLRAPGGPDSTDHKPDIPENAIVLYTDGASSHNPGPAGIGVVLRYKDREKEISKYIGEATNNVAELTAILEGLRQIRKPNLPVRIFTDSQYAFGVLFSGWKARANGELIARILKELGRFPDVKCYWVRGHNANPDNEKADLLATSAIKNAPS